MTDPVVDKLNEGQRDCLRLVRAQLNSKEIARELGVSPHTVDQRLRTAMRVLNVQSRFEAARKFAAYDQAEPYQPLIYQAPPLEPQWKNGKLDPASERNGSERTGSKEDRSSADHHVAITGFDQSESRHQRIPIPRYQGEKNSFAKIERLGWVLVIAIAAALSFGGLIAGLEALSRLKG
jgi:DNA-binding CsgD family transcriptional regulator